MRNLQCVRYGAKFGGRENYRVFTKYFDRNCMFDPSGQHLADRSHSSSYSFLKEAMRVTKTSQDTSSVVNEEGSAPRNQFQIHSNLDLPRRLEFNTAPYSVGRLDVRGGPGYSRLDARLGWRLSESIELSVSGENLLDTHHLEFAAAAQSVESTKVKRSVYGKLTRRFQTPWSGRRNAK